MVQVLYRAKDVRDAIRSVLGDPSDQERIAIVAFVGQGALKYLPHPKGIKVYCWPRAGGTNPYGIDALRKANVEVTFVERMHAKVYWSRTGGTVIGSSNLTDNALGVGGLTEVAVHLPPGEFDASLLLRSLHPVEDFEAALRELRTAHNLYYSRNHGLASVNKRPPTPTFAEWFSSGASRAEWRLGWYDEDASAPADTIDEETRDRSYLATVKKNSLKRGVFTLEFFAAEKRRGLELSDFSWWLPDVYRKTHKHAWKQYPHIWFAAERVPLSLPRPFRASEPRFQKALRHALSEMGGLRWLYGHSLTPSSSFLSLLHKCYVGTKSAR